MNSTLLTSENVLARRASPALRLVQSSRTAQRLARALVVFMLLAIVAMAFVPWQQTAKGSGKVAAFVPQERQQTVLAPVKGIVERVAQGLVEGARVKQGDFIVSIAPAAANLNEQLQAQRIDLQNKLATAHAKAEVYSQNIEDFSSARDFAVRAASELVAAAESKLRAKQQLVTGYEAKELQTRLNLERQTSLFEKGIKPQREIEKLQQEWDSAKADLAAARAEVAAAGEERSAKQNELEQKRSEAQTKVDYSRAMRQDALGQVATTQKDIRDLEIKLSELERMVITAPRDGTIFRLPMFERGQTIKEGDRLFTIVPETAERAVELWVSGNDTPLVRAGDHVRLQFEGWPAVQFAGWPSVSVGTFGGVVQSVDATDDGSGKFRVLVRPEDREPWPEERYLRQGVRANGWVMLNQVTLGYELWRQLNGFPPMVSKDAGGDGQDDKKSKPPLPK